MDVIPTGAIGRAVALDEAIEQCQAHGTIRMPAQYLGISFHIEERNATFLLKSSTKDNNPLSVLINYQFPLWYQHKYKLLPWIILTIMRKSIEKPDLACLVQTLPLISGASLMAGSQGLTKAGSDTAQLHPGRRAASYLPQHHTTGASNCALLFSTVWADNWAFCRNQQFFYPSDPSLSSLPIKDHKEYKINYWLLPGNTLINLSREKKTAQRFQRE